MKKISLVILMLCCYFMITPKVMASSVSTVISGDNTVTVGSTTKIYIKLNSSAAIEGVDVTFKTSGNISVTNVSVGNGLSNVMNQNNRYILYAGNPIASGSNVLVLTVKGNAVGTGTISVTNLEATVSGETAYGNTATHNITVKAKPTTPTNPTQPNEQQKPSVDNTEDKDDKQAISKATILVEAAEKSLLQEDYEAALNSVNKLPDSSEKAALLKRLDAVRIKIEVEKACGDKENSPSKCEECKESSSTGWIILCIALFICLLAESGYLIYKTINKKA